MGERGGLEEEVDMRVRSVGKLAQHEQDDRQNMYKQHEQKEMAP